MTSEQKIEANRRNGRKSRGPRTAAGKLTASRNALRHGLASITHRQAMPVDEIKHLAQAICANDNDPLLLAPAIAIAENEFVLRTIRQQKIVVIERLRKSTAIALSKGDNSFTVAKARFLEMWLLHREVTSLVPILIEKYRDRLLLEFGETGPFQLDCTGGIVPVCLKALLDEPDSMEGDEEGNKEDNERALEQAVKWVAQQERDEYQAIEEAISDLVRLVRYERRTWSRQKRAIRALIDHRVMLAERRAFEVETGTSERPNESVALVPVRVVQRT